MTTDLTFEVPRGVYDSENDLSRYLQARAFTADTFFWEVVVLDNIAVIQVIE